MRKYITTEIGKLKQEHQELKADYNKLIELARGTERVNSRELKYDLLELADPMKIKMDKIAYILNRRAYMDSSSEFELRSMKERIENYREREGN